jgi:hypothetical protein
MQEPNSNRDKGDDCWSLLVEFIPYRRQAYSCLQQKVKKDSGCDMDKNIGDMVAWQIELVEVIV